MAHLLKYTLRNGCFLKRISCIFFLSLIISFSLSAQKVIAININESINPSSAEFIYEGIQKAQKENAECLIINLNTPGGLLVSTREIVTNIMKSDVPVIVYDSPSGAK
jgi:membrane-bound serine protease (ClpP class)